jgi:hypothetical protein
MARTDAATRQRTAISYARLLRLTKPSNEQLFISGIRLTWPNVAPFHHREFTEGWTSVAYPHMSMLHLTLP